MALTELDSNDPDRAFGLHETGQGVPKLGYVSLTAIAAIKNPAAVPITCDLSFQGKFPISVYAQAARQTGCIAAAELRLGNLTHAQNSASPASTRQTEEK